MSRVICMVALAVIAILVVRGDFGSKSKSYLELDEFLIGVMNSHTPTQETGGLTLEFVRIEGGADACRGVEIKNHGMYVELRLVRATAPESVQAEFPLLPLEGKMVGRVEIVHDRSNLERALPIEYRIYGGDHDPGGTIKVTPVL
jgi:hypothetical protein